MYLHSDHAVAKVQYGCHSARQAPELLLRVPTSASGLDDRVQASFVRLSLDQDHPASSGPNRFATDDQFNSGMSDLAFGIGSVAHADKCISIAASNLQGAAVSWRQCLDDSVRTAFCLHRLWRPNSES